MKISNFGCPQCLSVTILISILFCVLAYNFSGIFLPRTQLSNEIDRAALSKLTETKVNYEENVTHSQSKGYIIPYKLYEQQTSAARNLWGLQLWANSVDMKVVEPFISEHGMSFQLLVNGTSSPLRFSDMFDRDFWNSRTTMKGCAPLVDWEEFLNNAPRKTILAVPYNRDNAKHYKVVDSIDDPSKITGKTKCYPTYFNKLAMKYFTNLGFHFVREVCIMFTSDNPMTMEEFAQHIFGQYKPSDVTVIFAQWNGIRESRINLRGVKLTKDNTINVGLMPSKKVIKDSDKYVQQFVPAGRKYFGAMIRVERILRELIKKIGFDKALKYMTNCAAKLAGLQQFKDHHEWGRTLAIDMGKLGSLGLQTGCIKHQYCGIDKLFNLSFTSVFGEDSWSIEEYEDSFTQSLSTHNSAYIAQLQRTIAARSDCIIMIGGKSNFQSAAISYYKNFHPNVTKQCIIYHCYYGVDAKLKNIHIN